MFSSLKHNRGQQLGSLFVVLTIICFLGTTSQLLTHLHEATWSFILWWILKTFVSTVVLWVPIAIGATQQRRRFNRQVVVIALWVVGAVTFIWAKFTTQPVTTAAQPSPELYVVQQVFITWLISSGLFLFAQPLQKLCHRWPTITRRHWLIGLSVVFLLVNLISGYDAFGFHRGTSLIWFIYLFALGDWLVNDRKWLQKWSNGRYAILTITSLLFASLITWLNMNRVDYSPHSDLTPNTHYLLGINPYQPFLLLSCLIMAAWFFRKGGQGKKDDLLPVTGILLLNLLGLPMIFTPLLLPRTTWQVALILGFVILIVLGGVLFLINFLGNKISWQLNYRSFLNWFKKICKNYWPVLLTYLILWVITLVSFAILWDGKFTMVQWMLTERSKIITVNVLIVFAINLILMAITNRWWISSGITVIFYLGWFGASVLKIAARNEPIIPTDISTLTAPGAMLGMVNKWLIIFTVIAFIAVIIACWQLEKRYGNHSRFNPYVRICAAVISCGFLFSFNFANHSNSIVYKQLQNINDTPYFYSQLRGAKMNGTLLQFVNNIDVHVMNKPAGYSAATMNRIAKRYSKVGAKINQQRTHKSVGKQNLVFVLSESYSDPARVPGMKVSGNPIPYLHRLKKQSTSGLMLSSGYGGGTANMEYQALTGLSIASFSPTLPTPYSQLVPYQKRTFTINNLFNYSIGIHPFSANLYSRKTVYKKFGFNKFYHFDGGNKLTYTQKIHNSPRVSDDSAYQEVTLNLKRHPHGKFVQLATMQNHMPYGPDYYAKNNFHVSGKGFNTPEQKAQIETYIQGIHYTDQALKKWIKQLDSLQQPTTVVWYGDHLPGIYHGLPMGKYGTQLHETDYFIYSNAAARKANQNRLTWQHQIVGPNNFAAMALAQMDVKVSPYYALMTAVAEKIPATSLPTNGTAKNNSAHQGGTDFVDARGKHVKLNAHQKKLFHDYQLVQYDLTAGHHYLMKDSFLKQVAK
ncbi:LTA synthase family protein [Limosilactobacillus sp.]|nr:alkaline phosphatase family protein [Limosilactobacillus sp.]MCI2030672.1 sulfatase-like hydrolase/transferase [Limosilactobacillus sp.]